MIENPLKTDGWDKDGDFDETLYLHFINIGWIPEDEVGEED